MVEVKNVTLFREEKTAEFPDAVTTRGSKHLKTLIEAVKKGYKSGGTVRGYGMARGGKVCKIVSMKGI